MQDQDRDRDNFGKYYSDEASRIHAPKDLVERTRAAMKAEASMPVQSEDKSDKMLEDETRKKRKNLRIWIPSLAAACLCIVILGAYGGYRYYADNHVNVEDVILSQTEDNEWEIGVELGKIYPKQQEDAPVEIISGKKKNIVPEQLWKIKPSMIKGQKVYIGADRKEKTYHAAWEKAGTYYYASSDSLQEDEFLDYLKKNIESL